MSKRSDEAKLQFARRLIRGGRLIERVIDDAAGRHGLTVAGDYEVLVALWRTHPEPVHPADLSDITMVSTSAITGRLDRLEGDGYVRRVPNPADRRVIDVVITESGRAVAESIRTTVMDRLAGPLDDIAPSELQRLAATLQEIVDAME